MTVRKSAAFDEAVNLKFLELMPFIIIAFTASVSIWMCDGAFIMIAPVGRAVLCVSIVACAVDALGLPRWCSIAGGPSLYQNQFYWKEFSMTIKKLIIGMLIACVLFVTESVYKFGVSLKTQSRCNWVAPALLTNSNKEKKKKETCFVWGFEKLN